MLSRWRTAPPGTYDPVYILSPDLRQDDKPRVDKLFVIPEGSVYRTAISAPGVKTDAGGTVTVKAATGLPTSPALTD